MAALALVMAQGNAGPCGARLKRRIAMLVVVAALIIASIVARHLRAASLKPHHKGPWIVNQSDSSRRLASSVRCKEGLAGKSTCIFYDTCVDLSRHHGGCCDSGRLLFAGDPSCITKGLAVQSGLRSRFKVETPQEDIHTNVLPGTWAFVGHYNDNNFGHVLGDEVWSAWQLLTAWNMEDFAARLVRFSFDCHFFNGWIQMVLRNFSVWCTASM